MKILEECSELSEIPSADVRSVRPLKMVRTSQLSNKEHACLLLSLLPW